MVYSVLSSVHSFKFSFDDESIQSATGLSSPVSVSEGRDFDIIKGLFVYGFNQ